MITGRNNEVGDSGGVVWVGVRETGDHANEVRHGEDTGHPSCVVSTTLGFSDCCIRKELESMMESRTQKMCGFTHKKIPPKAAKAHMKYAFMVTGASIRPVSAVPVMIAPPAMAATVRM